MAKNDTLQRRFYPADTGFSTTDVSSVTDGTYVGCRGMNQASLFIKYVYGAGTSVAFTVSCKIKDGTGDGGLDSTEYVSTHLEDGGSGTINSYNRTYTVTGTASWNRVFNLPINCDAIAVTDVTVGGSPTSSDTLTVDIITSAL